MKPLNSRKKQAIETKLKITDSAIKLFKKHGYEQVKVSDICKAADISIGAFYHHFKSKENIFTVTYQQVEMLLEDIVAKKSYDSPLERLYDFIDQALKIVETLGPVFIAQTYRLLLNKTDDYVLSYERYTFATINSIISQLKKEDQILVDETVEDITYSIIRFQRGIIFDWCMCTGCYSLRDQSEKQLKIFLSAIIRKKVDCP